MIRIQHIFGFFMMVFLCNIGISQDLAYTDTANESYKKAYHLAFDGNHKTSKEVLLQLVEENPKDTKAIVLLARTYSWSRQYEKARALFNKVTTVEKENRDAWIAAIKNELYAKNNYIALGLANKALKYLKSDTEIERLQQLSAKNYENTTYPELSWADVETDAVSKKTAKAKKQKEKKSSDTQSDKTTPEEVADSEKKKKEEKKELNNRVAVRNSFTVFDQRYDPMVFSTIEFKRQTLAGSLLPRINYANRNGKHGLQYDIDFYPKFSKRFYAYLNYGYSDSEIYPNHKLGGDLYVNLPWALEFSAGGRFISLDDRDVTVITNSIGHYRGNYYFSLRSSITPQSNNLTRFSGNLLVRKYLKDAYNFFSFNVGMGYSPELRQLISGDELLAETLLYIESQRMSLQYQFTGKKNPNIYSASIGVSRRELSFESGTFVWGISAGLAYQVKF